MILFYIMKFSLYMYHYMDSACVLKDMGLYTIIKINIPRCKLTSMICINMHMWVITAKPRDPL